MKKSRFTEEQIAYALRQAESGTPVADVCRQMGCSEASFYLWKKRYGNLGATELRELRQLRDKHILGEVVRKKL
jgi:putative transposase